MARRWGWLAAFLLVACTPTPAGPRAVTDLSRLTAWAEAGTPLPVGVIVGQVALLTGDGPRPAPNVTVRLRGLTARTDATGRYAFGQVPAGPATLQIAEPGYYAVEAACSPSDVMGVPRVNLLLVPTTSLRGQPADVAVVAGVVTDPRGAAIPGGSVHLVDSSSLDGQGSNLYVQADAQGYYVALLTGLSRGPLLQAQASLTAFGTTPGGVRVESRGVTAFSLGPQPTYAVPAATDAFLPPEAPQRVSEDTTRLVLRADRLPTRRDELTVRFQNPEGVWEVAPAAIDGSTITIDRPPGCCTPPTRVRLATFGVLSPLGGAAEFVLE